MNDHAHVYENEFEYTEYNELEGYSGFDEINELELKTLKDEFIGSRIAYDAEDFFQDSMNLEF